jgi:TonB-dependent SusC/RagA subfamily outer membrane receptor
MPPRVSRASLPRAAAVLICASTLVTVGGCRHGPPPSSGPVPAGRAAVAQPPQASDGRIVRRFPGLDVVSTRHGAFLIRLHSGLVGAGAPLYVIDGAPLFLDPGRGIDWLKPDDVARVEVLTRPAETAIYGPRGVNGVIVITTKRR